MECYLKIGAQYTYVKPIQIGPPKLKKERKKRPDIKCIVN